jgi:hypothetical protein
MNKFFVLTGLLFFNLTVVYSQLTVEYTNQFFASHDEVSGKDYFVFIYPDGFIFATKDGANWQKIKIEFNTENAQNSVFVAKNLFFNKQKESLYIYDLAKLTQPGNDGKRLDRCAALVDQIDNLNYVAVSGNDIRYTKNGDDSVYKYVAPSKNGDPAEPVKEPVILTGKAIKYIVYNPYSKTVDGKIADIEKEIRQKCERTENDSKYSEEIKNVIKTKPSSRESPDALYGALKDILRARYNFSSDEFKRYKTYTGMREIDITKKIMTNNYVLNKTDIDQLYKNMNDLDQLNSDGITSSYEEKTWNAKKEKIKNLAMTINDPDRIKIKDIDEIRTHIIWRDNYSTWKNRKQRYESDISSCLDKIKKYLVYRCRERICGEISGQKLPFKFDSTYLDYCVLSDKLAILNSIDTGNTISAADFTNIRYDTSSKSPKFIQPLGNSIVNVINSKQIFVLKSKDNIYALDMERPWQGALSLKVKDNILCLLQGGNRYQYAITRNGGLKRYSIKNGEIIEESLPVNPPVIDENVIILLNGDEPHTLSASGLVDGTPAKTFRVKSSNSNNEWIFSLKEKQFSIDSK